MGKESRGWVRREGICVERKTCGTEGAAEGKVSGHTRLLLSEDAHTHKQTNAHTDTRDLFKCQPHKMEIKHPAPLFADKKTLALSVSPSSFCWGKLLFECLLFCSLSCLLPLSVCWPLWEVNRNTGCSVFLYRIIAGTQHTLSCRHNTKCCGTCAEVPSDWWGSIFNRTRARQDNNDFCLPWSRAEFVL